MAEESADKTRGRDAFSTQEQFRDRPVRSQSAPSANTDTTLYTVPKGRQATVNIHVCERGGAAAVIRIALRLAGAAIANEHYVVYGFSLAANDTASYGPFELTADDVITVRASTADTSFNANGYDRPRDTT